MRCVNHPGREGGFYCFKFRRPLCLSCLVCQDPPPGRCRDRTACLIWEFHRHGVPDDLLNEAALTGVEEVEAGGEGEAQVEGEGEGRAETKGR